MGVIHALPRLALRSTFLVRVSLSNKHLPRHGSFRCALLAHELWLCRSSRVFVGCGLEGGFESALFETAAAASGACAGDGLLVSLWWGKVEGSCYCGRFGWCSSLEVFWVSIVIFILLSYAFTVVFLR